MTNRERDIVADLLRGIAARLTSAPEDTEKRGEEWTAERLKNGTPAQFANSANFEVGTLQQICRNEAHAIMAAVNVYLTPAPRQPRTARGRR